MWRGDGKIRAKISASWCLKNWISIHSDEHFSRCSRSMRESEFHHWMRYWVTVYQNVIQFRSDLARWDCREGESEIKIYSICRITFSSIHPLFCLKSFELKSKLKNLMCLCGRKRTKPKFESFPAESELQLRLNLRKTRMEGMGR